MHRTTSTSAQASEQTEAHQDSDGTHATRRMTRIVSTVRIHRDSSAVFDFFTTPSNAPSWHPASISVGGSVEHSLAVGEEFTEDLKGPVGVRGSAAWEVAEREAPKLWRIDLKGSTPDMKMDASVTLRFRSEPGATVVERDVQYRYGKPWAALCDALFLRRRNEREGHSGLQRAKQILEGATHAGVVSAA